jgi:hypothetical protein
MPTFQLSSGQIVLGLPSPGTQAGYELAEMEGVQRADKGVAASVISLLVTLEAWDAQTIESAEDSDDIDCIGDAKRKTKTYLSSCDIVSWRDQVVKSGAEPPSPTPSPFEKGKSVARAPMTS